MRVVTALASAAVSAPTGLLHAQCPDGTPPPCEVRVRQAPVEPPAPDQRARSILVLPFRNLTRSAEHEWLVDGSVAMLVDALQRWREITVVPPRTLYPALQRHGLIPGDVMAEQPVRRMATETGAWTVVDGEFLVMGPTVRVTARSYDIVSNAELARTERAFPTDGDPRDTFDALAMELLAGREDTYGPEWEEAVRATESIEAYRAGVRGVVRLFAMDFDGAADAFRESIALDSNYALPHVALALSVGARAAVYRDFESMGQMLDPESEVNRAMRRAATLSAALPERERMLFQGIRSLFRTDFPAARAALRHVVEMDSMDVDALAALAYVEFVDPVLVDGGGLSRRRGSINDALRLFKRVTMLTPRRTYIFAFLARIYREAAGHFDGFSLSGWEREPQSMIDFAMSEPAVWFIPVLRDSMELVIDEAEALAAIGPDSMRAARLRALRAARGWANEWLTAAAPDDARPHDFLSSVEELAWDVPAALAALERAETLETDSAFGGLAARRAVLRAKAGQYGEATRALDSLWSANRLEDLDREGWFPRTEFLAHAWAFGLWLTTGRIERADSAWSRILSLPALEADGAVPALAGTLEPATSAWWKYSAAALPATLLLPAIDSLLESVTRLPSGSRLAEALPLFVRHAGLLDGADRAHLAEHAVQGAIALGDRGQVELAAALARVAVEVDPTVEAGLAGRPWYREPDA